MAAHSLSPTPGTSHLQHLLEGFAEVRAADDRVIAGLALDSRQVAPGALFFACAGGRVHGIEFIEQAISAGAVAVVYEAGESGRLPEPQARHVPMIAVPALAERLGLIADRFHRHPSRDMTVIGITGTNGKTSCCHYLAQALSVDGRPCGVIGTLGYGAYGGLRPGRHTTPDALTLHAELARMRDSGINRVAMEVSSHALQQARSSGVAFTAAVFTNLSHDHLDYHGDLVSYGLAKKKLFRSPGLRFAVINCDDPFSRELTADLAPQVISVGYGLGEPAERPATEAFVRADIEQMSIDGMRLHIKTTWGEGRIESPLVGRFNAANLLATLAVLLVTGMPFQEALQRLPAMRAVPGRMERFGGTGDRPLVIVDYAHTPEALQAVLQTLRQHGSGRLWCVFGCGGERDRAKRPLMGAVAGRWADHVILTSDNPRSEDPHTIIEEIQAGVGSGRPVDVQPDRAAAIRAAIAQAMPEDVVLIAGKGHEDYQLIGDARLAFSDRAFVQSLMEVRGE